MKQSGARQKGKGGIELVEEAIHLLRTAPPAVLTAYYTGAIPFVLGLLFFWAEMSRSAFADQTHAPGALILALLFLWMKVWQSISGRGLRAVLMHQPAAPLGWTGFRRILWTQAVVQPSGLFILPVALVLTLPFAWVYAFYQNVTMLDDGERDLKATLKLATDQAALWPRQNHIILAVLAAFGLFVLVNWITACAAVPYLVKTVLGIETMFTRSGFSLLNTTFFMTVLALTYLTLDPILKAVFALRCFYGSSLKSGDDLKAELRTRATFRPSTAALVVLLAGLGTVCYADVVDADPASIDSRPSPQAMDARSAPGTTPASVSAPELERQINSVLAKRKYAWRLPRETLASEPAEKGVVVRFMERVLKMLRKWIISFVEWLDRLMRRLFNRPWQVGEPVTLDGWTAVLKLLVYVLAAAIIGGLLVFIFKAWRRRSLRQVATPIQTLAPALDLTNENVGPDRLPEDGWLSLARELWEKGELRLALRAFYLASLAHLADRNLVTLASSKSNLEYQRELARRAHAIPGLREIFGENLLAFERIWYGMHEINAELLGRFAGNVQRIKERVS